MRPRYWASGVSRADPEDSAGETMLERVGIPSREEVQGAVSRLYMGARGQRRRHDVGDPSGVAM